MARGVQSSAAELTYQQATIVFCDRDRDAMGGIILRVSDRVARTFVTPDRDGLAGELAMYLWRKFENCRRPEVILDFLFTVARRRALILVKRERSKTARRKHYEEGLTSFLEFRQRRGRSMRGE